MVTSNSSKGFQLPFTELQHMNNKKPEDIRIITQVPDTTELIDKRLYNNFARFGNIMDVARQYGIKSKKVSNGIEFYAPKSRLQMFVEKLHFSQMPFREI